MKPPIYDSNKQKVDPSDKKYTKVCSYMPECNYNKNLSIDYDITLDTRYFFRKIFKKCHSKYKKENSFII